MTTREEADLNLEFQKRFSEIFMKFKTFNQINFTEPKIVLIDYPNTKKNNIVSRDFKSPYINKDDEVGGNLYKWIHQSYSVLWEVDKDKNEIILYTKTNEKLGLRFATVLRMDKAIAINGVLIMCSALALTEFYFESKFEYSRLAIADNLEYIKIFDRFIRMFGQDLKSNID